MKLPILLILIFLLFPYSDIYAENSCAEILKAPYKLKSYENVTTSTIFDCLTLESQNILFEEGFEPDEFLFNLSSELSKRQNIKLLLERYDNPTDEFQREWIMVALVGIDDKNLLKELKARMTHSTDRVMYYCVSYVAKNGDEQALKILNDNYHQYGSSFEWAGTVLLFGKYKYKPAILNLIESLDAASLNLVGGAQDSLEKIFKGPHPDFKTLSEMKLYFKNLYKKSLTN